MDDDKLLPNELRSLIANGQVVAFVGAGFTKPLGLPSWGELVEQFYFFCDGILITRKEKELLEEYREQIKQKEFVTAFGGMRKQVAEADYRMFLTKALDFRRCEACVNHAVRDRMLTRRTRLLDSPWAGIVTTNLDDYLESKYFPWHVKRVGDPFLGHVLSLKERFYVKLHGGTDEVSSVMTSEDYAKTYLPGSQAPTVSYFLNTLMLSYPVVFIGCSLEPRILEIRQTLSQVFSKTLPKAWALMADDKISLAKEEQYWREHHIKIIRYGKTSAGDNHLAVDHFLELTSKCRQESTVDVNRFASALRDLDETHRGEILASLDAATRAQVNNQLSAFSSPVG
ncbi:MAG: hypothetical protein B7Z37_22070 [Verrucomicrobia bacterium 12-59-8]|nr:MAG: hypothetical protein B7Z37_22070 [Verrucomicrobia bacterium 12-59-8]